MITWLLVQTMACTGSVTNVTRGFLKVSVQLATKCCSPWNALKWVFVQVQIVWKNDGLRSLKSGGQIR